MLVLVYSMLCHYRILCFYFLLPQTWIIYLYFYDFRIFTTKLSLKKLNLFVVIIRQMKVGKRSCHMKMYARYFEISCPTFPQSCPRSYAFNPHCNLHIILSVTFLCSRWTVCIHWHLTLSIFSFSSWIGYSCWVAAVAKMWPEHNLSWTHGKMFYCPRTPCIWNCCSSSWERCR